MEMFKKFKLSRARDIIRGWMSAYLELWNFHGKSHFGLWVTPISLKT